MNSKNREIQDFINKERGLYLHQLLLDPEFYFCKWLEILKSSMFLVVLFSAGAYTCGGIILTYEIAPVFSMINENTGAATNAANTALIGFIILSLIISLIRNAQTYRLEVSQELIQDAIKKQKSRLG
jgi:hypothetical protein